MLQKLAFLLSCKTLASDHHNSNKTARKKPFPATVETSHTCPVAVAPGRQWPWLGVAGVAVVQYYFLTFDLHAIFNVFLCYTLLHADPPWPWLARA